MIKFVDLTPPSYLKSLLDNAYNRVLNSGSYILNSEVKAFEEEWADYNQTSYCVSCGNGFDALQLCMRAFGIDAYSQVVVPAFTAPPVWASVLSLDARAVVHDQPNNATCSISVNLFGERSPLLPTYYTIEDSSQAHGLLPNKDADVTVHSFYPTKNLGALGDGGSILTNNMALYKELRDFHNYAKPRAINSRLDELQAAFLRVKLRFLNQWNDQRLLNARAYNELLNGLPLSIPCITASSVWHQYPVICVNNETRNALKTHLANDGIETVVHYPIPPHKLYYTHGYSEAIPSLLSAENKSGCILSLPIAPHITTDDIDIITKSIARFFEHDLS